MTISRSLKIRALQRLLMITALAAAAPAYCQRAKPVEVTNSDKCLGVVQRLDEVGATAPGFTSKP